MKSAALVPISDKLQALIRMLSSDRDGEILAAVRAIRRTLHAAKLDIHALADSIGDMREIYESGVEDGRRAAEQKSGFCGIDGGAYDAPSWRKIAEECQKHSDRLRDARERRFVNDMARHRGEVSEKQADWLRAIYARVRAA